MFLHVTLYNCDSLWRGTYRHRTQCFAPETDRNWNLMVQLQVCYGKHNIEHCNWEACPTKIFRTGGSELRLPSMYLCSNSTYDWTDCPTRQPALVRQYSLGNLNPLPTNLHCQHMRRHNCNDRQVTQGLVECYLKLQVCMKWDIVEFVLCSSCLKWQVHGF